MIQPSDSGPGRGERRRAPVFILSDATGITAERVINAALVQFKETLAPEYLRFPFIKSEQEIKEVMAQAEADQGIVIYSLAQANLRAIAKEEQRRSTAYTIDLLGPLLDQIGKRLNAAPSLRPGLMDDYGDDSLNLVQAIHYTLRHDDGQRPEELHQADMIILGVSRTSKTPTSLFLACHHNLKVANVPIIQGIEPPWELFTAPGRKIGFTITPARLSFLRRQRFKNGALPVYTDREAIIDELKYCQQIYNRVPGLELIDVTNTPIEETANRII